MNRLLHTMIRVNDLNESLKFYVDALGMKLLRKHDYSNGEFHAGRLSATRPRTIIR